MSNQQNSSGKTPLLAWVLTILSLFFPFVPPVGTHRLYLGKHISGFFYFFISLVAITPAILFQNENNKIMMYMEAWAHELITILLFIDILHLSFPSSRDGFMGKAKNTPIFTNEYGQYPINNSMFVYVFLGTMTFLSIVCFWCSGKILCFNNPDGYSNYTGCVWVLTGNNNLYDSSGKNFVPIANKILGSILAEKITGFMLLFIGLIIFSWYYYSSKYKPSLNTQNKGNYLQNDEVANALANLKRLYDSGAITEAEYNEKRKKYLDSL